MSSTGALNDEMSMAIKHLAKLSSRKMKIDYSKVIGILRCQLAFALARSALLCLRGSRSIRSFVQPCEDPFSPQISLPLNCFSFICLLFYYFYCVLVIMSLSYLYLLLYGFCLYLSGERSCLSRLAHNKKHSTSLSYSSKKSS